MALSGLTKGQRTADNGDEAGSLDEDSFEEWHPRGPPTKPTSVKLLKPVKQDKKQSSVKDQDKKQVKKPQNNGSTGQVEGESAEPESIHGRKSTCFMMYGRYDADKGVDLGYYVYTMASPDFTRTSRATRDCVLRGELGWKTSYYPVNDRAGQTLRCTMAYCQHNPQKLIQPLRNVSRVNILRYIWLVVVLLLTCIRESPRANQLSDAILEDDTRSALNIEADTDHRVARSRKEKPTNCYRPDWISALRETEMIRSRLALMGHFYVMIAI
ncbi:hypothetical protein WOLCODRAFT_141747 [Wolfiporia cocos MD-104 SS10]|uniref:Uncharacterized protein n=1 Tax=Wolfiporia cocos (strain MD-104) TaxID=742152 RepID=A0A2H3IW68_WOLCO|nr:hypothetical protein WOLCODRAFT_141747 [Wolfiporia cocos MD-104 SS10]